MGKKFQGICQMDIKDREAGVFNGNKRDGHVYSTEKAEVIGESHFGNIMGDADDYDFYDDCDDEFSDAVADKPDCYGVNMSAETFPENGPYHSYIPFTLTGCLNLM